MSRRRTTLQSVTGRVKQVLPVGGKVQLSQRAGGLPPHCVRQPSARCQAKRRGDGRSEYSKHYPFLPIYLLILIIKFSLSLVDSYF